MITAEEVLAEYRQIAEIMPWMGNMGTMPWMGNMGTNGNQGLGIIVAMLQEMQGSAMEKQQTLMSIGLS